MIILLAVLVLPSALAAIPIAVLFAILIGVAYHLFDRWSIALLADIIRNRPDVDRKSGWQNLSVISLVMLVTALSSIVVGARAGIALACVIFIVRISRPTVRAAFAAPTCSLSAGDRLTIWPCCAEPAPAA